MCLACSDPQAVGLPEGGGWTPVLSGLLGPRLPTHHLPHHTTLSWPTLPGTHLSLAWALKAASRRKSRSHGLPEPLCTVRSAHQGHAGVSPLPSHRGVPEWPWYTAPKAGRAGIPARTAQLRGRPTGREAAIAGLQDQRGTPGAMKGVRGSPRGPSGPGPARPPCCTSAPLLAPQGQAAPREPSHPHRALGTGTPAAHRPQKLRASP